MDLYYFDATGFSLEPVVPYAWQPAGKTINLPARSRYQRLNVFGFLSLDHDLRSFCFEKRVDTNMVIACFDIMSRQIEKPTVVVLDNSSVHTSAAFRAEIPTWKARGMTLYYLPAYAPELNLIEILWRMIKYQWLPFSAYRDFPTLVQAVKDIIWHGRDIYRVQFN